MAQNDNNDKIFRQKINPISVPQQEIGIDINKQMANDILSAIEVGNLDVSAIEALTQSAQTREQAYSLIESMAQDDVISAVLETYAEDTVQSNDRGQVIWIEADDSKILDYTSWILDTLNVDKHIYQWAYCLVTYGDVYLRLYRQSDVEEDMLFKDNIHNKRLNESRKHTSNEPKYDLPKQQLDETAKLRLYSNSDRYIPYVEMVNNPGEMFDLQKFGKTQGYIQAPVNILHANQDNVRDYTTRYKIRQNEVEIFDAMSFVHGCIENTSQREPETVDIYLNNPNEMKTKQNFDLDDDYDTHEYGDKVNSYTIKRGQSILYNSFRIWRELNLLEMSALLNRLTKSAVTRILNVDVGDMPKEQVQNFLQRLKTKIEQKAALNVGEGMSEYNNPSPIENTIYVPTHNGQGQITQTTIGGDFDPKSLVDIEYFRDKLFGSLKVPKQFYGFTEDGAGFNGGQSLTILSSRYGKSIKNLQNILRQMISDVINLFLIDRGLDNYVNKFTVRMQEPVTQEELDRRTNTDNRINYIGNVMQQLQDIDDKPTKLKIYKALLSGAVSDQEVIGYLQDYIESLEAEEVKNEEPQKESAIDAAENKDLEFDFNNEETNEEDIPSEDLNDVSFEAFDNDEDTNKELLIEDEDDSEEDSYLPSPAELHLDMTK